MVFHFLAQVPDPTSALPGWLVGGGASGILGYLLIRSEKRQDNLNTRLDACEERYRQMVDKYAERTFTAVSEVARAVDVVQRVAERDRNGR